MNEKPDSSRVWHRMARYAMITAVVQTLLGIMLYSTMYGRGPLSLLFLIPMVNIAYPLLLQNAIRVELWPAAIAIGTFFMFLVILAIGETDHLLGKQVFESERRQESHAEQKALVKLKKDMRTVTVTYCCWTLHLFIQEGRPFFFKVCHS